MHTITIRRKTSRAVHAEILSCQVDLLIRRALSGTRGKYWRCLKHPIAEYGDTGFHIYEMHLEFYRNRAAPDDSHLNAEFLAIRHRLNQSGRSSEWGDNPWEIVETPKAPPPIEVEPDRNYSRYRIKIDGKPLDEFNYDRETACSIASALSKYQRIVHA